MSAVVANWWLTVLIGIVLIGLFQAYITLILGGVLMDVLFGAPMAPLWGFQYLYTALFLILVGLSWYLHRTLSE
ncbi:MAG: hypothetical protein V4449_03445 [Patescibacteria group bacterium]